MNPGRTPCAPTVWHSGWHRRLVGSRGLFSAELHFRHHGNAEVRPPQPAALDGFPRHKRGGQGVIAIQTSKRNGSVVGATLVGESDELMLITSAGTLVRTRVDEISVLSRNTQGVRIIRPGKLDKVVGVDRIEALSVGPDDDLDSDEVG